MQNVESEGDTTYYLILSPKCPQRIECCSSTGRVRGVSTPTTKMPAVTRLLAPRTRPTQPLLHRTRTQCERLSNGILPFTAGSAVYDSRNSMHLQKELVHLGCITGNSQKKGTVCRREVLLNQRLWAVTFVGASTLHFFGTWYMRLLTTHTHA